MLVQVILVLRHTLLSLVDMLYLSFFIQIQV